MKNKILSHTNIPLSLREGINKKAFTLVELLISITILIVLSVVSYNSYMSVVEKSERVKTKANLSQMKNSLIIYKENNSTLPNPV